MQQTFCPTSNVATVLKNPNSLPTQHTQALSHTTVVKIPCLPTSQLSLHLLSPKRTLEHAQWKIIAYYGYVSPSSDY
jgi:hypothetical protein